MSKSFYITSLLFICLSSNVVSQETINWLTWEEALELNRAEKKKFLIDVHTEWCTWCKKMDERTFQKENIAKFANENYYAVKFDAEQKEDIIFNNKIYSYVAGFGKKGYHELAEEIMNGRMSYPTVVFIDEDLNVIQPIPGFQNASTFSMIMDYFAGNYYTSVPWAKFEKNYYSGKDIPGRIITTPASIQPAVQPVRRNH